eukprot:TRINITY_DN2420_c0_g1_i2.p1 TRINITY_DN2420_c0_g1~~TRINITY_DN2420_c0_g1_i2.p1  ORF type:complete len:153 (+),score=16.56 TRINITY_DN2420_c0_g1_i2:264-722(+)
MVGTTRVINCVGHVRDSKATTEQLYIWGLRNILNSGGYQSQSDKPRTLKQVVLLSSSGITRPWNVFTALINTIVQDTHMWHLKQERLLRESGVNYIIVRPPFLGSHTVQPEQVEVAQGDNVGGYRISRSAVAEIGRAVQQECRDRSRMPSSA